MEIYREEILTAPEKSGFSLTAWILPFAALLLSGVGLFLVIRKWVKRKGTEEPITDIQNTDDKVEEEILSSMIDEERKKYL